MDITISPGPLHGSVTAIPSKSQAHRLLICAALADRETILHCPQVNQDMEATAQCLKALGAGISYQADSFYVMPIQNIPSTALLDCQESGSTLRFLLPLVGALGVDTTFRMAGRLPSRPLSPLWEALERMGCRLSRPTGDTLRCQGTLRAGHYTIAGGVSSQFITGLLFALSQIHPESTLEVTGKLESKPYVDMTLDAFRLFDYDRDRRFHSPGELTVEGDWSNAAFFLAAQALGNPVTVENLRRDSLQGDRAVEAQLWQLSEDCCTIDASDIPDLVPILATVAGAKHGARFQNIQRLRLKESDRVATTVAMLTALGGKASATEDTLTVYPAAYRGGTVSAAGDHRIAMAAAIAATVCQGPVTISGAEAVRKSYPHFWEEYRRLGGKL